MFSGIDVGVATVADFCQAVLDGRAKLPSPHSFKEKITRLIMSSAPDAEHRVGAIMGADTHTNQFVGVLSTASLEQVRSCVTVPIAIHFG